MDVKIKHSLMFVDKFHFYFGKIFLILIITNAISLWKQEDKELLAYTYIKNLILIIPTHFNIHFVDLQGKEYILPHKIIVKSEYNIYSHFINILETNNIKIFNNRKLQFFNNYIQVNNY